MSYNPYGEQRPPWWGALTDNFRAAKKKRRPAYGQPGTGAYPAQVVYTYPQQQTVYTTQPATVIVDDCHHHHHHHRSDTTDTAAQCCLIAMTACLCAALCAR